MRWIARLAMRDVSIFSEVARHSRWHMIYTPSEPAITRPNSPMAINSSNSVKPLEPLKNAPGLLVFVIPDFIETHPHSWGSLQHLLIFPLCLCLHIKFMLHPCRNYSSSNHHYRTGCSLVILPAPGFS